MTLKPGSKADLAIRLEEQTKQACVLSLALNYIIRKETVPVGKASHYTVAIAGPTDCHGGIVLVTFSPPGQRPITSAYYFEAWFAHWESYHYDATFTDTNMEALAIRSLAFKAKELVNKANSDLAQQESDSLPMWSSLTKHWVNTLTK